MLPNNVSVLFTVYSFALFLRSIVLTFTIETKDCSDNDRFTNLSAH